MLATFSFRGSPSSLLSVLVFFLCILTQYFLRSGFTRSPLPPPHTTSSPSTFGYLDGSIGCCYKVGATYQPEYGCKRMGFTTTMNLHRSLSRVSCPCPRSSRQSRLRFGFLAGGVDVSGVASIFPMSLYLDLIYGLGLLRHQNLGVCLLALLPPLMTGRHLLAGGRAAGIGWRLGFLLPLCLLCLWASIGL